MESFKRWCKHRAPAFLVLVVVLGVTGLLLSPAGKIFRSRIPVAPPGSSAQRSAQPSPSLAERAGATTKSDQQSPQPSADAEFSPIGSIKLDSAVRSNITAAVRIWSAYPNHEGRSATLAKLRRNHSVSPEALTAVALLWTQPQTGPVNVTVQSVVIEKLPTFVSATQATFEGVVTRGEQYSDGKITHVRKTVDVLLTKVGGVWRIARLVAL